MNNKLQLRRGNIIHESIEDAVNSLKAQIDSSLDGEILIARYSGETSIDAVIGVMNNISSSTPNMTVFENISAIESSLSGVVETTSGYYITKIIETEGKISGETKPLISSDEQNALKLGSDNSLYVPLDFGYGDEENFGE